MAFCYVCSICGGGNKRCGFIDNFRKEFEDDECDFEKILKIHKENDAQDIPDKDYIEDLDNHIDCKGGYFCWESGLFQV